MTPYIPLSHLDKHGRVKPHWLVWLIVLFLLRPYMLLIGSLASFGQDSGTLLAIFYPENTDFYRALGLAIPAWFAASVLSFRDAIAKAGHKWPFKILPGMILFALCLDVISHMDIANAQRWRFSWSVALSFVFAGLSVMYCVKSRLLKAFSEDWQQDYVEKESTETP